MVAAMMVPTALLLAGWGRVSLRWAAGPGVSLGWTGAVLSALLGYLGVALAAGPGGFAAPWEVELCLCVFGALLLGTAWTDHRTAWAPDGVVLPLMISAAIVASLIGPLTVQPVPAMGVGVLLFGLAQVGWAVQALIGTRLLPPPDLMSLGLPVLLFGLTPYAFLSYLALSVTLLLMLRAPEAVYLRLRGPAASEAVLEAGLTGAGRSAPFLPMALGSVYGVLLLRLMQG